MDREQMVAWFRRNRERSREIFAMIPDASWLDRPIPLRHPFAFYEGHLPAFNLNTLAKKGHGLPGVDDDLEVLFERGIDPGSVTDANRASLSSWPSRAEVRAYGEAADRRIEQILAREPLHRDDRPAMNEGQAAWTILEHEPMHHETLLYMIHALDPRRKRVPDRAIALPAATPRGGRIAISPGTTPLGASRKEVAFAWDNELEATEFEVAAFEIDRQNVTNAEFLEFIEAGGYRDSSLWSPHGWRWLRENGIEHPHFWRSGEHGWLWRTMRGETPLPGSWPVWVTHAEASAYARWKRARLPTEAEYHRAAFGSPVGGERSFPWGEAPPDPSRGNFDQRSWDPVPVGSFPAGASAWGVEDLVGNGWEWTSTPFAPFDGFEPMPAYPEYSADFFDGEHFVLKGASPATPRELIRRSFRNWFRPTYPWVWASFRCAR